MGEAGLIGKSADPPQVFEGQSFTSLPFPGLAMNKALLSSLTQLGATCSALFIVPKSDLVGRKPVMLMFLFGGACVYCIMMFLGDVKVTGDFAYYGYAICKFLAGLLGGSKDIANVCIQDIFDDPKDKATKSQATMPLGILGASIGAIVGMTMYSITGRLMAGGWVAMGISIFGGILFATKVPMWMPPPKGSATAAAKSVKNHLEAENVGPAAFDMNQPRDLPQKLYMNILLASCMDSVGTAGLFAALTLILYTKFGYFVSHPAEAALTSFGLIVFILIGLIIAIPSLRKNGAGYNAAFGNIATCCAQILLIICNEPGPYLAVLYIGVSLSFFSTVAYMPMLIEIAPPAMRGKVMGQFGAVSSFVNFIMPLSIAILADFLGNEVALAVCAAASFGGFVKSLPLVKRFPAKSPEVKITEEEQAHIDADPNWFSATQLNELNKQTMKEGKPMTSVRWGDFSKDKEFLVLMHKLAQRDFADMRKHLISISEILEAGGAAAEQFSDAARGRMEFEQTRFDAGECEHEAKEMGLWIASYLQHAGHGWNKFPSMYKVMIMSAFPPMPKMNEAPLHVVVPAFLGWFDKEMHLIKEDPFNSWAMVGKYHGTKIKLY